MTNKEADHRAFKMLKAGIDVDTVATTMGTSTEELMKRMKRRYPFMFEKDVLTFVTSTILVVDPSFVSAKEIPDGKIVSTVGCSKCRDIYERLAGTYLQPLNKKYIIIDRVPPRFSWRDYSYIVDIVENSLYPIIIVVEDKAQVTSSIQKMLPSSDIRKESPEKVVDLRNIAYNIFSSKNRDEVYKQLMTVKTPWQWIIGWLREGLLFVDEDFKKYYYEILEYVDKNKFLLKKEYLLGVLAYGLFAVGRSPRLNFPLQWKKKEKKVVDKKEEPINFKKVKAKKTPKRKREKVAENKSKPKQKTLPRRIMV